MQNAEANDQQAAQSTRTRSRRVHSAQKLTVLGAIVGLVLSMFVLVNVPSAAAQAVELQCPEGMVPVGDFGCLGADESAPEQAAIDCPLGSVGPAGGCYRLVAPSGCVVGVSYGNLCQVFEGLPLNGPTSCAVGPTVMLDGNECFTLIERTGGGSGDCPANTTPDPDGVNCRRPFFVTPGEQFCDGNGALLDGRCYRFERNPNKTCAPGATLDAFGYCREPVESVSDTLICQPGGELDGSECVFTLLPCSYSTVIVGCEQGIRCPDGFVLDEYGLRGCIRGELASQAPSSCPDGASGIVDACFLVVPRVAETTSASASTSADAELVCPVDSFAHPDTDWCIKPLANLQGARYCASPFGQLHGIACVLTANVDACSPTDTCVHTESALIATPECGAGNLGTAGACYRYINELMINGGACPSGFLFFRGVCDTVGEFNESELRCPISVSVFEDGDECYVLVSPPDGDVANCSGSTPADPTLEACRRPVNRIPTPIATSCDPNFALIGSTCRRYLTPPSNGFVCNGSIDVNGRCRIDIPTQAVGDLYCENPDFALDDSSCFGVTVESRITPRRSDALTNPSPLAVDADVVTSAVQAVEPEATAGSRAGDDVVELAFTGGESIPALVLALGMLGAGASCAGVARVRRRGYDG